MSWDETLALWSIAAWQGQQSPPPSSFSRRSRGAWWKAIYQNPTILREGPKNWQLNRKASIPLHPSAPCGTLKGDRLFAPQAPRCPCRGRSRSSWVNPRIPRKRRDRAKRAVCFALCQSKLYVRNMTARIRGYLQEIVTEKYSTRTKNEVKLVCRFDLIFCADSEMIQNSGLSVIAIFILCLWNPIFSQYMTCP